MGLFKKNAQIGPDTDSRVSLIDPGWVRTKPTSGRCCELSAPLERFQFVQRAWPIGAQQSRQTAIRENLAARLAAGAIIRLFISVADAQHFFTAPWAWLAIAAVHRHAFAESRHLLWKFPLRCGQQPVRPELQCTLGCI